MAVTLEEIDARKNEATGQMVDPAVKSQLEQLYQQARQSVESRNAHQEKLDAQRRSATKRPQTRQTLLDEAAQLQRLKAVPPVTQRERTLDAQALESLLELTRSERATLEGKLGVYELKLRTLASRPAAIATEKTSSSTRLAQIESERAQMADDAVDPVSRARVTAYDAEIEARHVELEALNLEQLGHEGAWEITNLRREVALLSLERLSARITALEELLIERREASALDAQATAELTQGEIEGLAPAAQALVRTGARHGEELAELVRQQSAVVRQRADFAEQRQRLSMEYETSRQRLQIAGASSVLGRLLVDQRRQLPRISALVQTAKSNAAEVSRVSLRRIEIDEQLRSIRSARRDPAALLRAEGTVAPPAPGAVEKLASLLDTQEALIKNLDSNYAAYLRVLDAAESELQQLITTVTDYTSLLDSRLLWIPNARAWSVEMLRECSSTVRRLFALEPWRQVAGDLAFALEAKTLRVLGFVAVLMVAFRAQRRLRRYLAHLADRQREPLSERVRDTVVAAALSVLVALPLPLLSYEFGVMLQIAPDASALSLALSQTFKFAAILMLCAYWWREALRRNGLLGAHFGLAQDVLDPARRNWTLFSRVFIPSYALALNFDWQSGTAAQSGVARVLYSIAMIGLFGFAYWLARRGGPLSRLTFGSALEAARPLWRLVLVAPPLVFGALSAVGYHYTAVELSRFYLASLLLIAFAILAYRTALRWLRIARDRLRREDVPREEDETELAVRTAQLEKFDAQARLIVQNVIGWSLALALFGVWKTVLPALSVLDRVNLWDITIKDAAGATTLQPVTFSSVALAGLIALITMIASRNLPGVLEFGLLQRLQVTRGSRYAITSLLQYAIVAIGFSIVLSTLGLRWSQVQWLVAALGVGLGFGLQEIFANFISGLILLFERPIRVGDVVTIGDMTGQVTRIQIRATTIKDGDNKEIVVPNKTFITDRFLNWTLSDQVTRIVLQVGVAYGTDVDLAIRLLLDLARAHPKVMSEPAPQAVLVGFGDSALTLELQVHAEELKHRGDVRHELNTRIYRTFRAHGIEIPFPQRDLHIRSGRAPLDEQGLAPDVDD